MPPEKDRICSCCGQPMAVIGEEITEELDYVPASFLIREHARPKFACSKCQEGVVIAPLPDRPIEKGRLGPGLLAHIVVSKYADHLPLHRQEGIYCRDGLELSKSTLCDAVADVAELLQPVYEQLRKQVLGSKAIQTDDTPVLLRHDAEAKSSKRCFLFAYGGDRRDWVYEFTTSRSRAGPLEFFGDYRGLRFLGIESSPAFVREPEGNGCAERFIRTFKEQLLWLAPFDTVEELRRALLDFQDRYNREWLIERHGFRSPTAAR